MAHLLLLLTVVVWGATFSVVKMALRDASPSLFNLLRMVLATAVLLAVNWRRLRGLRAATVWSGLIAGLFLAAGYQLQTVGLLRTTPTKSAMLTGLVVIFVPLFSVLPSLRPPGAEAPGAVTGVGAAMAFAGLFLLTTPAGTRVFDAFGSMSRGDLLSLGCAVAFAGHLLALAHFAPGMPTAQLATLQIGFAAVVMGVTLPVAGPVYLHWNVRLAVALLITGVLGTALAFTVQSWSQQHMEASHVAVLLSLEPVFALLTSALFYGERFSGRSVWGMALILGGISVLEMRSRPGVNPSGA